MAVRGLSAGEEEEGDEVSKFAFDFDPAAMPAVQPLAKNVSEFLSKAAKDVGRIHADRFDMHAYREIVEKGIASPIEQLFYAAMQVMSLAAYEAFNPCPEPADDGSNVYPSGIYVRPQVPIGKFRVDFLCANVRPAYFGSSNTVLVELDGHDFHDKDKRQRSYEKARDRFLARQGYTVLHYTGSDVVADPYKVAHEVLDTLQIYGPIGCDPYDQSNPFGIE